MIGLIAYMFMWLLIYAIMILAAFIAEWWTDEHHKNHLIVISNHVKTIGMEYPKNAIIRVNIAWAGSVEDVKKIIDDVAPYKIYLDYPTGRRKPPQPTITLNDAITICNQYPDRITHFAFSNAESGSTVGEIRMKVTPTIKLVPKIETRLGVDDLEAIMGFADNIIMLDAEDLYVDCNTDPTIFNKYKNLARKKCKDLGITCLELKGVVFSD